MIKADPLQTNFSSGELSPHLLGRTDIERYRNGAEILENWIVRHQGGITQRRGTKYLAQAPTHTAAHNVRVVEFVFSRTDTALIEISAGQFRFYVSDALVYSGLNPYAVTTVYGTSTAVPYTSDDIHELQFTQSADVLYITHPDHPPATLSRYGSTDWRFEQPEFEHGPYLDQGPDDQDISLTISNVTDRVILTSTATDFSASVANDLIEYQHRGQKVLGKVTIKFSNYQVEVEPLEDRSLVMPKEIYSPGLYTGWDGTNSVPTYNTTITGSNVSVAFSAVAVVTQEHIGNYLRFADAAGVYYWMLVDGVGDILRQGAYGIIATGDVLTVTKPTGKVTRSERHINARLTASESGFFNLSTDYKRLFRLVLGGTVVHARGRAQITRNGDMAISDRNIGMTNTSGILVGDTVSGTGVPGGSIIEYIVANTYIHISQDPTATNAAVSLTINANTTTEIGVELNRSLPKSVEGLTAVDKGTSNDWNRGAWYTTNYPSTVVFHEGRLCFGGTDLQPQTVWMSVTDDLYNFAATTEKLKVLDDSAITFTIASDTVNILQWMSSREALLIGTVGGEWKVSATTQGSPITPTTVTVKGQSTYGSAFARPINIGNSTLFLQRGGRKLRQMKYDYQVDSMVSLDLTVFSEHILKDHGGAEQLVYQQLPESAVYARLVDGQIAVLTYEPDQQVYAWSRFVLGGPSPVVESMAVLPSDNGDRLHLVVSRTVDGANHRTIEVLEPEFRPTSATNKTNMIFLDAYREYFILSGSTVTGLDTFAGEDVNVLINDLMYYNIPVTVGGVLTMPVLNPSRYAIGYPFTTKLKTFPLELPTQTGTTQHKQKRISHLNLRLLDTIDFKHGRSVATLITENFRVASDPVAASAPMFSGDKRVVFECGFSERAQVFIVQDNSYPITLLSLTPEVAIY